MTKYLPTILLVISGVLGAFDHQIQGFVAAHGGVFSVVATFVALVAHYLPSPAQAK